MQSLPILPPITYPLLLLLLLVSVLADAASYRRYLDCAGAPFTCGNLSIVVGYPFRLYNRHDYCGYPGFVLTCTNHNSTMTINIGDYGYQVNAVDYMNHLLTVVDTSLTAQSCPQPYKNTTIDPSLYLYTDRDENLTVFINCTTNKNLAPTKLYDIDCLSSPTGLLSYYMIGNRSLPGLSEVCDSTVVVQVNQTAADRMANGLLGFGEAVQAGFNLRWMPGKGWCMDCVNSGGICGYDYSSPDDQQTCYCPDGLAIGTCSTGGNNVQNIVLGVGVGVGGAGFIAASLLCFLCYRRKKRRERTASSKSLVRTASSYPSSMRDPELGGADYHTHIFSYEELREATNGFDASRELGDGGFGTVYEGKLRDGRIVAVKRLYENNYKRVEQFMNEVDILSRLRHQNLVTLYGCTSRHSRELLLVYEFISNGTIADHLHGPRAADGALTWPVRMRIAIETADALAYLHAIEPQIIHRDVKTNNILLDDNFHVKVGDFGLSRLFPLDATHVSTLPQGTPGYVDPEYHQCYQLTDKSDVYSFGVVLVEMISSKPAVDISRSRNEINLASMAINKIQNSKLDQLIDPGLGHKSDKEKETMITQVAELAFRCLQGEKEMRPSIKEVLEELRRIQSGGYKSEKGVEADAQTTEDTSVPKKIMPYSPDSVIVRWESRSTTPNTSTVDELI